MTGPSTVFNLPPAEAVRQLGRSRAVLAGLQADQPGPAVTAPRPLGPALTLVMVVPRTDVGGGARILFELANRLLARGHQVHVLSYAPPPTWFHLRARFSQVGVGEPLAHAIPACDVVLVGYWELLPEIVALQVAPVIHIEQGDFHLFEELAPDYEALVCRTLATADAHTVVSSTVAKIMHDRYGIVARVVPNAVDPGLFRPPVQAERPTTAGRRSLIAVGWDGNSFKGIEHVRTVAARLRATHPDVDVVWVTPKPPNHDPGAIARVVVAPSERELAALYGRASVYLCASDYESFGLPVMEAMSCGTPVVSTRNPGALEYCRDGDNALLVAVADAEGMYAAAVRVLDDAKLASRLSAGGSSTAASFTWDEVMDQAEAFYRQVAESAAAAGDASVWAAVDSLEVWRGGGPAAEDLLRAVLSRSGAEVVEVPVSYPTSCTGVEVSRWEPAYRRPGGRGVARVAVTHRPRPGVDRPAETVLGAALAAALEEEGDVVRLTELGEATARCTSRDRQGTLLASLALHLLGLGRSQQALELLISAWDDYPDHPDLFLIATWAASAAGFAVDRRVRDDLITAAGRGSRFDEHLILSISEPPAGGDPFVRPGEHPVTLTRRTEQTLARQI